MDDIKKYLPYIVLFSLYVIDQLYPLGILKDNVLGLLLTSCVVGDFLRTCVVPSTDSRYKVILVLIMFYAMLNNSGSLDSMRWNRGSETALPGYHTMKETADKLGFSNQHAVVELCEAGEIKAYKVAGVWFVPNRWFNDRR
jgi:hypothetical protein